MAQTIKHYDRAQNIYASGVTDTNAANAIEAGKAAGLEVMCEVKVVPTDIFGNILEKAKVTINSGSAKTVEDFGNIAEVKPGTDVTYKVELDGYEAQEGSISSIRKNELVEVTLPFIGRVSGGVIPATGVTVTPETLELEVGQSQKLIVVVEPSNSTDAPTFESAAPQFASVSSDGTVKAEAEGSASIVVKAGEQSASCAVTVKAVTPPVEKVTITINPTPADATVKLNGVAQSSIEVDKGTEVSYEVSKEGYTAKSATVTAETTQTIEVVLDAAAE